MTRKTFSVAVFARHQGRVLLIKHKRLGTWLPVGGELEPGETPLEAAIRELKEETGLVGRFHDALGVDGTPKGLMGYEEHPAGSKGTHLNFAFVADVDSDHVVSNGEFGEHRWVTSTADVECPRNVRELAHLALHGGGHPLIALARAWLKAFNARDLEALVGLYAANAVHTSPKLRVRMPETKGEIAGAAALRAWWKDSMERLPGMHYAEQHLTASGNRVFMEYLRTTPGEDPLVVAEVLVTGEDGKISNSHVFHG